MIQDIAPHRLDNQYRPLQPQPQDTVLVFAPGGLLCALADGALRFPARRELDAGAGCRFFYLFALDGRPWFLAWPGAEELGLPPCYQPQPSAFFRGCRPRALAYAAVTAFHLWHWYDTARWCGHCGAPLVHDGRERMMRCPACGNLIYPRISPSVIAGVCDGDRILMTRYAGRAYTRWALVAGFTEIGETPEQTVAREVREEVGLAVKNIRYWGSQPWGFTGGLLLGYFCELDGSDAVTLDESELACAQWTARSAMDETMADDGVSLTRAMMRAFALGQERAARRD